MEEPNDHFRHQEDPNPGGKLNPVVLLAGAAAAPTIGVGLGVLSTMAESSGRFHPFTQELVGKAGIESLVQLASSISPTALVTGTVVGLAGVVALATHDKKASGQRSDLPPMLAGAAGMVLGSIGAMVAAHALSGGITNIGLLFTCLGGISGALSAHALGTALPDWASQLLGNRAENKV